MNRAGIVIVTYNSREHLPALFAGLEQSLSTESACVCMVDNASTDGSADWCDAAAGQLPCESLVIRSEENRGFSSANNCGVAELLQRGGIDPIIFLNPDTVPQPGWLEPLIAEVQRGHTGSVASLLLLPDGRINSRGNAVHWLGYGFVTGYGDTVKTARDESVFFGTGAAVAVSLRALESLRAMTGGDEIFWNDLFLYGEDQDLGWRLRLAGWDNRICVRSRVTHHSEFVGDKAGSKSLFYLERNRWLIVLANYRLATLILLAPFLAALELVQLCGWRRIDAGPRRRIWRAVWNEIRAVGFWRRRRSIQRNRQVSDRAIIKQMTGSIRHGAMPRRSGDGILDGVLTGIHRLLIFLVRW